MKRILCFGDSNTYGYRPDNKERFSKDERWTGILWNLLGKENYTIIEEGLCGRTTIFPDTWRDYCVGSDALPKVLNKYTDLDEIIIMLGTNDCKKCYKNSPEEIGKGIEVLIKQVRNKSDAEIVIISPILLRNNVGKYDPDFDDESIETSAGLKNVYRNVSEKYGCKFMAASDYAEASTDDRVHMNTENHRKLAYAIKDFID